MQETDFLTFLGMFLLFGLAFCIGFVCVHNSNKYLKSKKLTKENREGKKSRCRDFFLN